MDWTKIIEVLWPILTPLIQLGLSALTGYLLALLAGLIKEKMGIIISEKQLNAAKEAVVAIEEMALARVKAGFPKWTSAEKKDKAIERTMSNLKRVDNKKATGLVETAVAIVPTVGTSADCKISSEIPVIPGQVQPWRSFQPWEPP
jgi:hypothetical protein